MSEVHAAFGVLQLQELDENINKRKDIYKEYIYWLKDIRHLEILVMQEEHLFHNYSYLPLLVKENKVADRDDILKKLADCGIFARKYFHPLITNTLNYKKYVTEKVFPVSEYMSKSIVCLPIYPELNFHDVNKICSVIRSVFDKFFDLYDSNI